MIPLSENALIIADKKLPLGVIAVSCNLIQKYFEQDCRSGFVAWLFNCIRDHAQQTCEQYVSNICVSNNASDAKTEIAVISCFEDADEERDVNVMLVTSRSPAGDTVTFVMEDSEIQCGIGPCHTVTHIVDDRAEAAAVKKLGVRSLKFFMHELVAESKNRMAARLLQANRKCELSIYN